MSRIAFGHKARSGKDTAAEYLANKKLGVILRFASPVYELTKLLIKCPTSDQEKLIREFTKLDETTEFVRDLPPTAGLDPEAKHPHILQYVGNELRKIDPDIWVRIMANLIAEFAPDTSIFIPDLRYPNECEMLKKRGFTLVRVDRKNRPIDRDPNHPSEIALDNYEFDVVIPNDGTIADYYEQLDKLVSGS